MYKVIKRDGRVDTYKGEKIVSAITKAMKYGSGIYKPDVAERTEETIFNMIKQIGSLTISQIEDMIFQELIRQGQAETAKAYEGYKEVQAYKRQTNTTDDSIIGLLNQSNVDVMSENSNKNPTIASTQRDLIAGEVSKDIARRKLIPSHLIQAHDEGSIHIHK